MSSTFATEPYDLDEVFEQALIDPFPERAKPLPLPTGLSDEEDAARHLALRFNRDLVYCPNCEWAMDKADAANDIDLNCPRCWCIVGPVGTKPYRRKLTP